MYISNELDNINQSKRDNTYSYMHACTVRVPVRANQHTHARWCLIFRMFYAILFELICFITVVHAVAVLRFKLWFVSFLSSFFFVWLFASCILLSIVCFDQMHTELLCIYIICGWNCGIISFNVFVRVVFFFVGGGWGMYCWNISNQIVKKNLICKWMLMQKGTFFSIGCA